MQSSQVFNMACPWDYDEMETVLAKAPNRESQIMTLLNLFGSRSDLACPSIFIYGHTSSGKSLVIKTLMKHLKVRS